MIGKLLLTKLGTFLVVLTFGIFLSSLYFYMQSIFIEKELIRKISKTIDDLLNEWSISFILTKLRETSDILNNDFGESITLSGGLSKNYGVKSFIPQFLDQATNSLDRVYLEFKNGTFSEVEVCKKKNFTTTKEDCKILVLSHFPLNLIKASVHLSVAENIYGIMSQKAERLDGEIAKILLITQDMAQHGALTFRLVSNFRNFSENCVGNITGLSTLKQKEKYRECSIKALNKMQLKSNILTKDIKITELNIPECAQYLPLIEAKNLEKYLSDRLVKVKNPYLAFYYAIMVRNLEKCSNEVFKNLKTLNIPCYRPDSISLAVKSIASTISTSGSMAFCMNNAIRNEIGD